MVYFVNFYFLCKKIKNRNMKKNVTACLSVLLVMSFFQLSAASYRSVVINKTDNTNIMVLIESTMTTSIVDGTLVVTSSKGNVVLPVSEVKNWFFSTDFDSETLWTGLQQTISDTIDYKRFRDKIVLNNLPEGSIVDLFTINGRQIKSSVVGGQYQLFISELSQGIYLLKYNNQTIKIVVAL